MNREISDIAYGEHPKQKYDLYLPDSKEFSLIVYFHGGALEGGDKADGACVGIAQSFVARGYAFASVNYRLYNDGVKFPDFIEDCACACAAALERVRDSGHNGKLVIAGQSAGGYIALMLCCRPEFLAAHGIQSQSVDGWLIDSAQTTAHYKVLAHEREEDCRLQRIDEYAPLYYVNADLNFQAMLVDWYSSDMPCRAEQNMLFVRAVREFAATVDISTVCMEGTHCSGSIHKDAEGEYPFVRHALRWLSERQL